MANTEIILRSSTVKLKAGLNESATISWNTLNAKVTTLYIPNVNTLSVANTGQYTVTPNKTTTYSIEATFENGEKQTKSIVIEVLPQAVFSYDVKEHFDGENVSVELTWSIKYAKNISLDGLDIVSSGFKSYLIEWPKSVVFKYDDAFGNHKEVIHMAIRKKSAWILVDAIKLLLRPFTFIGYVGKKEFWWSFLFIILGLAAIVIPRVLQIDYDSDLTIYRSGYFLNGYKMMFVCIYLLLMLLAKRWKDAGESPWYVLWFSPVVCYPLLPFILKVSESTEGFYSISAVCFILYLILMLTIALTVGSQKTEYKPKYKKIHVW